MGATAPIGQNKGAGANLEASDKLHQSQFKNPSDWRYCITNNIHEREGKANVVCSAFLLQL